jgi:hypothetical protein
VALRRVHARGHPAGSAVQPVTLHAGTCPEPPPSRSMSCPGPASAASESVARLVPSTPYRRLAADAGLVDPPPTTSALQTVACSSFSAVDQNPILGARDLRSSRFGRSTSGSMLRKDFLDDCAAGRVTCPAGSRCSLHHLESSPDSDPCRPLRRHHSRVGAPNSFAVGCPSKKPSHMAIPSGPASGTSSRSCHQPDLPKS